MKISSRCFPLGSEKGYVFKVGKYIVIGNCYNQIMENPIVILEDSFKYFRQVLTYCLSLDMYYHLSSYTNKPIPVGDLTTKGWRGVTYFGKDVLNKDIHFGKPKTHIPGIVHILVTYEGSSDYSLYLSSHNTENILNAVNPRELKPEELIVSFLLGEDIYYIEECNYVSIIGKSKERSEQILQGNEFVLIELNREIHDDCLENSVSSVKFSDISEFIFETFSL